MTEEKRYLLVFPGLENISSAFAEETAKLQAEGFKFTGETKEVTRISYVQFEFVKEKEA